MSLLLLANNSRERKNEKENKDMQKVTSPYYFILPLFMPNPMQLRVHIYIRT